ncbi:hypothetical protein Pd630_LPD16074 (plasmid) [Rhodococcus opacus PD630]|nr:hypothetical protein Pd630_LPD16074 [Rhodococcus opacus PD630]
MLGWFPSGTPHAIDKIRTEKASVRAATLALFRRIIDPLPTISSVPQTL